MIDINRVLHDEWWITMNHSCSWLRSVEWFRASRSSWSQISGCRRVHHLGESLISTNRSLRKACTCIQCCIHDHIYIYTCMYVYIYIYFVCMQREVDMQVDMHMQNYADTWTIYIYTQYIPRRTGSHCKIVGIFKGGLSLSKILSTRPDRCLPRPFFSSSWCSGCNPSKERRAPSRKHHECVKIGWHIHQLDLAIDIFNPFQSWSWTECGMFQSSNHVWIRVES